MVEASSIIQVENSVWDDRNYSSMANILGVPLRVDWVSKEKTWKGYAAKQLVVAMECFDKADMENIRWQCKNEVCIHAAKMFSLASFNMLCEATKDPK